jgi:hypothetical protein
MTAPEFRIVEFKYPHPISGARFWIEWLVDEDEEIEVNRKGLINFFRKILGLELLKEKKITTVKRWAIFNDPASTEINTGYKTVAEANYTIDRYRVNMRPVIHNYEWK